MQTLTKLLVDRRTRNRLITDTQLGRLIEGSAQRRHHLVNRAMKAGELIRLRRGAYILSAKHRDFACHPYSFAQVIAAGSYISLETALAYHGWIPEAVRVSASITPGRKSSQYENESMGKFTFHPLAIRQGYFLELIERQQINGQTMWVAKPIRALMDLICLKKIEWKGVDWIEKGLRIDHEYLSSTTGEDIRTLKLVYKQNRVQRFLEKLELELAG